MATSKRTPAPASKKRPAATAPASAKKKTAGAPKPPPAPAKSKPKTTERGLDAAVALAYAKGAAPSLDEMPDSAVAALAFAKDDEAKPKSKRKVPATSPEPVLAQIRELEEQLDRLIDEASRHDLSTLDEDDEDEAPSEPPVASAEPESEPLVPAAPVTEPHLPVPPSIPTARVSAGAARESEPTAFDTARELLSSNFYLRKWGRVAMRGRSEEVDDFGFDPIYDQKVRGALEFLYSKYFRVSTTGIDRVPAQGRCLLVTNHSGTLPLDGLMLKMAVKLEHASPRDVRWLTEDFITHMPWLGGAMNRLGAVRAHQENAERLLAKEQLVAVFPEGVKGIGKLFGERYRLQRFGRGGFIKLCLRTKTPLVPVAVVGAEETNPLLFRFEYLAKTLGVPYVPVTPTFPALGPLGLVPAPTKWQIHFGEPIDLGNHGRDAADDEVLVGKLAERVRATIQGMLDRAVGARKSVFFG